MSHDEKEEFDTLFKYRTYKEGFVHLKSYLKDLGTTVPTLFKQYAELYEEGAVRFFDFTVNEGLHGVVEGFIIADNSRMKEAKRKRYIKNFEIESEQNVFPNKIGNIFLENYGAVAAVTAVLIAVVALP